LRVYFHSPTSDKDIFGNAFFGCRLIKEGKIIRKDSIGFKDSNGSYYATIDLKETKADEVGGFFSEVTKRKPEKNKFSAGINTIYVFRQVIK